MEVDLREPYTSSPWMKERCRSGRPSPSNDPNDPTAQDEQHIRVQNKFTFHLRHPFTSGCMGTDKFSRFSMDLVIIILTGIVGGIVNCLLLEKGRFPLPYLVKDGDKTIIDPGGLGNMAFGIVASIIIFGLGAAEFTTWKQIAICLLSAAAGGNFITSMIQKENMNKELKKSQVLKEAADEAIKVIGKFASNKNVSISNDQESSN